MMCCEAVMTNAAEQQESLTGRVTTASLMSCFGCGGEGGGWTLVQTGGGVPKFCTE